MASVVGTWFLSVVGTQFLSVVGYCTACWHCLFSEYRAHFHPWSFVMLVLVLGSCVRFVWQHVGTGFLLFTLILFVSRVCSRFPVHTCHDIWHVGTWLSLLLQLCWSRFLSVVGIAVAAGLYSVTSRPNIFFSC